MPESKTVELKVGKEKPAPAKTLDKKDPGSRFFYNNIGDAHKSDDPAGKILGEIQGNILKSHGRDHALFFFIRFDLQTQTKIADTKELIRILATGVRQDKDVAFRVLQELDPKFLDRMSDLELLWIHDFALTSGLLQQEQKRFYKDGRIEALRKSLGRVKKSFLVENPLKKNLEKKFDSRIEKLIEDAKGIYQEKQGGLFLNFMLSAAGFRALGFPEGELPKDGSFRLGMKHAAVNARLSDPPITAWEDEYKGEIHALFIMAHEDSETLNRLAGPIRKLLGKYGVIVKEEAGNAMRREVKNATPGDLEEPFGFRDGMSQPIFMTEDTDALRTAGMAGSMEGLPGGDDARALRAKVTLAAATFTDPGFREASKAILADLHGDGAGGILWAEEVGPFFLGIGKSVSAISKSLRDYRGALLPAEQSKLPSDEEVRTGSLQWKDGIGSLMIDAGSLERSLLDFSRRVAVEGAADKNVALGILYQSLAFGRKMDWWVSGFGRENWDPRAPLNMVLTGDPEGAAHGSYFVFRKLHQDIRKFEKVAQIHGLANNVGEKEAKERIVGRRMDGSPLVENGQAPGQSDNFNYASDPQGAKCPFHSHVRTANPRSYSGYMSGSRKGTLVRRGLPYRTPNADSGLLFLSAQADIEEQFETLQRSLVRPEIRSVSGGYAVAGGGYGAPAAPSAEGAPLGLFDAVTLKGGEYFYAPSIPYLVAKFSQLPEKKE